MNDTVAQLIPVVEENRRRFRAFCLSLSEEEQERPVPNSEWRVKDFVAHLGTVDLVITRYLEHVRSGGQIDMRFDPDGQPFRLDNWNNAQIAEHHDWPLEQVFDEAEENRSALFDALRELSDDELGRSMHFTDPKRGDADFPLRAFLIGWAQHDPIHVADMLRALPGRANDEELASWLANPFVTGYQASMNAVPSI